MDNRPIGVCDSGVGGLTVVREIQRQLPYESVVYIGDTARVPYGGKDPETILTYGREMVGFLKSKKVKAVVIACGTISSNGFTVLKEENPDIPIFDVLTPGAEACAEFFAERGGSRPKRAGFIATEATVRSGLFARLLKERDPQIEIHMRACPLFTPLVEEGWVNNAVARLVAETYLDGWKGQTDAAVLGCTHFPLLAELIKEILPGTRIIDMAEYTVRRVKSFLTGNGMLNEDTEPPAYELAATGYTDKFEKMAVLALGKEYEVRNVSLK